MHLNEKLGIHLDQIKQLKGVENAVLTQRDGNPIQSAGVWFSKDDIFNISSATSAIFNVGIKLHPNDLKYILIEGKKAKILIAPLNSPIHYSLNRILEHQGIIDHKHEFFITITSQPNINLGGMFIQANEYLKKIKMALITTGESFKPPLIQFDDQRIQSLLQSFKVKENKFLNFEVTSFSLNLSESISVELRKLLNTVSIAIHDLKFAYITIEGGYLASKLLKQNENKEEELDNISVMSYSLFQTANRCAWLLKKMTADSILLDCEDRFQFIYGMEKTIFGAEVGKSRQKLGLIRLVLPQFSTKARDLIKQASELQNQNIFDTKTLLGELVIK